METVNGNSNCRSYSGAEKDLIIVVNFEETSTQALLLT